MKSLKTIPRVAYLFIGALLGVLIAAILVISWFKLHNGIPISNDELKKAGIIVFYPQDPWRVESENVSFNTQTKVLSVPADYDSKRVIMNQQAAPDQFVDLPQYFDKITEKMNSYKTIDSAVGKAVLTRPTELKGKQVGVLFAQGTLMFVEPKSELTDQDWRELFNSMATTRSK